MRRMPLGALAVATVLVSARAGAVPCDQVDTTPSIPILYIESGDTQEPMLKQIGKQLISTTGQKLRIVYRNRPTCELAQNYYTTRNLAAVANRPLSYIPEDPAFNPKTSASPTCDPSAGTPFPVDLAIGAAFLSSCPTLAAKPANVTVVDGPVQAYGFIANNNSSQVAITAEEGYFSWGFVEGTGEAAPWTVQNLRFRRGDTASTTLCTAAAIGLKAGQMKSAAASQTSLILRAAIEQAADQQAAIGVLGVDIYDSDRSKVKWLAFKGFGQRYAYYPDSTRDSFDKKNVRDGHYLPWSPAQYIYLTDGAADPQPTDAKVKRFVDLVFGRTKEKDVNGLDAVLQNGLVPQCAMKVTRASEGADLSLLDHPQPCGCYFEKNVTNGATTCIACSDDGPCGGGKCRFGFCEAK
jgi:hypothetical protein